MISMLFWREIRHYWKKSTTEKYAWAQKQVTNTVEEELHLSKLKVDEIWYNYKQKLNKKKFNYSLVNFPAIHTSIYIKGYVNIKFCLLELDECIPLSLMREGAFLFWLPIYGSPSLSHFLIQYISNSQYQYNITYPHFALLILTEQFRLFYIYLFFSYIISSSLCIHVSSWMSPKFFHYNIILCYSMFSFSFQMFSYTC